MRKLLRKVGEALAPYTQEAERDMETLKNRVSESIPARFKVFALTTCGVILVHIGMALVCLMSSAFWAMLLGKGTLPAAWFIVNLIVLVGIYDLELLTRWEDEGWRICEVCRDAVPNGNFCQNCGTPLVLQQKRK